jgi:predicted transcriptional regulator
MLRAVIDRTRAELLAVEDGTMEYVEHVRKGITATRFAEAVGITPQAANNRLKKLEAVGLLERRRVRCPSGGKQYEYDLADEFEKER